MFLYNFFDVVKYEEIQRTDICKKSIVGEWRLAPQGNKTKTSLSFIVQWPEFINIKHLNTDDTTNKY